MSIRLHRIILVFFILTVLFSVSIFAVDCSAQFTACMKNVWSYSDPAEAACQHQFENCQAAATAPTNTSSTINMTQPTSQTVTVVDLNGDVEYRDDSAGQFLPLTKDTILKQGMFIASGFNSSVTVNISAQLLHVFSTTQLRLDEFTQGANIAKTQVYLNIGNIEAKVNHSAAIRSDFSVVTPTATSAIRDSKMIVSYDNVTNTTTTYATSDVAYVKGNGDVSEIMVYENQKATIGSNGKAGVSTSFSPNELLTDARS